MASRSDNRHDMLTGRGSDAPLPPTITKAGEGGKFDLSGQALHFPGNTFICHIDPTSKPFAALKALQTGIKSGPAGSYFAYLPPASFHMTVFPAICGDPLGHDGWPERLAQGADLETVTAAFQNDLQDHSFFDTCTVQATDLYAGYSVTVEGAAPDDRAKLQAARDILQEVTGLKRPDFTHYFFHITLCYRLKWMPDDVADAHLAHMARLFDTHRADLQTIKLGPIEFCIFDTMEEFRKLQVLPSG